MPRAPLFSELSPARQILLRLCQSTNYGYIQDFLIKDREPLLNPESLVLVDLKLDSKECPREEVDRSDFLLCTEVVRLMAVIDKIQNGKVSNLEVRAGIPRRIVFENRISNLRSVAT